ncbi:MAG: hypothetical protein FRX49_13067 [Trebouxia sp. A1-2]|nr:MAG: hypothetical protein FRX49_13067 [Trebouxia sp. A1-2]
MRKQALDSQLIDTRAELQKLKAYQQQLETRNALLEKVSRINNQPDQTSSSDEIAMSAVDRQTVCDETSLNDKGRGVNVTLPRHQQHMTVQQISKLRLGQFAALWTDYIRELGMLLVHLGDRGDPSTQASMEHLTLESTQLLGCLKVFNPSVYKAVCQERLDGTNTVPARQLDVSWFMSLQELLSLSDAQMQDFAHLRHLYLTKRALLAFERKKLVNQMQESDSVLPHPADGQLEVSELAAKLRQNAADDYEVYIKLGYAVRRGVFSTKQWAMFIVHAYPFFPGVEAALELTAAGRGELSMHEIIAGAQGSPMAADWAALNRYLSNITGEHPLAMQTSFAQQKLQVTGGSAFGSGTRVTLAWCWWRPPDLLNALWKPRVRQGTICHSGSSQFALADIAVSSWELKSTPLQPLLLDLSTASGLGGATEGPGLPGTASMVLDTPALPSAGPERLGLTKGPLQGEGGVEVGMGEKGYVLRGRVLQELTTVMGGCLDFLGSPRQFVGFLLSRQHMDLIPQCTHRDLLAQAQQYVSRHTQDQTEQELLVQTAQPDRLLWRYLANAVQDRVVLNTQ